MMTIYNEILYRPLFNIMVYLQNVIPGGDLGITIIILTIVIRVLFMPLSLKTINSQKMLKELTPKIEELKTKFKNDKTAQSAAIMRLYKENNVNPLAGCLPLLVQIPILIALYRVFIGGITEKSLIFLYGFIAVPEVINHNFLGLFDITKNSPLLTIIAGGLQFCADLIFEVGGVPDAVDQEFEEPACSHPVLLQRKSLLPGRAGLRLSLPGGSQRHLSDYLQTLGTCRHHGYDQLDAIPMGQDL